MQSAPLLECRVCRCFLTHGYITLLTLNAIVRVAGWTNGCGRIQRFRRANPPVIYLARWLGARVSQPSGPGIFFREFRKRFDDMPKSHTTRPARHGGRSLDPSARHRGCSRQAKLQTLVALAHWSGGGLFFCVFSLYFAGGQKVTSLSALDSDPGPYSLCAVCPNRGRQTRDVTNKDANKDAFPFTFATYGEHPV